MSYNAWSVVFGEVPTDTKWNILGSNDDSFNDGTGIADDAIIQRHLADESVGIEQLTSTLLPYKELGRDTLDATGSVLEVVFTAKRYLRVILAFVANASGTDGNFKFNGDTGANYAQQYSGNFATPSTSYTSISGFAAEVGNVVADGVEFVVMDIFNPSGGDKIVNLKSGHQTALTAATVPSETQLVAMWNNGSQVTSIRCDFDNAVKAGAELIVLGFN